METPKESVVFLVKAVDVYLSEASRHKLSFDTNDVSNCFIKLCEHLHLLCCRRQEECQLTFDFESANNLKKIGL
jgi:hypothetical protein